MKPRTGELTKLSNHFENFLGLLLAQGEGQESRSRKGHYFETGLADIEFHASSRGGGDGNLPLRHSPEG